MTLRPPMAYYGGKTRLAVKIAALLPAHEHYIEPFAGSLAVLLAKKPSHMETVNDVDHLLMTFWRVLREQPDELIRLCALTPHSRAELDLARISVRAAETDADDLELARQVWLHRVSLECRPALEIVEKYGAHPGVCLYVDPPYQCSTRSKNGQGGGNGYRYDMKDAADHLALLRALKKCEASVLLSSYPSELYTSELAGWERFDIPSFTGQATVSRARTEVIWSNRPLHRQGAFGLHRRRG